MMKWVNALFARKKRALEAPAASAAAAPQAAPRESTSIPPNLLEAICKFGFDDIGTSERSKEPHLLQAVTMTRDNYLHRYFSHDHDILRSAYDDGERYSAP